MSAILQRAERALTYALTSSLGPQLRPKEHRGQPNEKDAEAIGVLMEIRKELGVKTEGHPPAQGAQP